MLRRWALFVLIATLTACGSGNPGALEVAVIDAPGAFDRTSRLPLTSATAPIRAAIAEGLVGFDAEGQVIPALADRWIVTEDGQSYIFRLREGEWPDGTEITGERAAAMLRRVLAAARPTTLGRDLNQIEEVRAMAGRVVEIRLSAPVPDLLQLLAQPELGFAERGRMTGPMVMEREGDVATLRLRPPEERGMLAEAGWAERARQVRLTIEPAERAVAAFDEGRRDVVLGGKIETLPLADIGLSRGTLRLDPVIGLFGLAVVSREGPLAESNLREAIAMAIDRDRLLQPFGVGGWEGSTRIVSPDALDDLGTVGERWQGLNLAERQATAASRVAAWRAGGNSLPPLRLAMPTGPGANLLFQRIQQDLAAIGLAVRVVALDADADLRLIDTVARYPRATWFLNQLGCAARRALCTEDGDRLVAEAQAATDPAARSSLLARAEAEITAINGFIPFGRPIRWSLARARTTGFAPNPWGWHPLPPLALEPR